MNKRQLRLKNFIIYGRRVLNRLFPGKYDPAIIIFNQTAYTGIPVGILHNTQIVGGLMNAALP